MFAAVAPRLTRQQHWVLLNIAFQRLDGRARGATPAVRVKGEQRLAHPNQNHAPTLAQLIQRENRLVRKVLHIRDENALHRFGHTPCEELALRNKPHPDAQHRERDIEVIARDNLLWSLHGEVSAACRIWTSNGWFCRAAT